MIFALSLNSVKNELFFQHQFGHLRNFQLELGYKRVEDQIYFYVPALND